MLQNCVNWDTERRCRFCGTGVSLRNGQAVSRKTPRQLARVAEAARALDGVSHMVLTSGTGRPPGSEIPYLAVPRTDRRVEGVAPVPPHLEARVSVGTPPRPVPPSRERAASPLW